MNQVELRYADNNEYLRIRQFLVEHWSTDNIYVREPKLFDWTFGRRNLWDREGYSFALAEDRGKIIGILGAIPFVLNHFGQESRALWLSNYMIAPDYRRGPLAVSLLQTMRRKPFAATIAFGINPRTTPLYQVLRWKVIDNIPRHFAVLPHAVERMAEIIRLAYPDWPRERAEALAKGFRVKLPDEPAPSSSCDLREDWDQIGWRPIAQRTAGAARDLEYLQWRYLDHPIFSYRLIAIRENDRAGLLVWRLETIRHATGEALDRIGRVVEFLPASRTNAQILFAKFLFDLREADAAGADFYCYHGETRRCLSEMGMPPVETHVDGDCLPARFQPLDAKSPAIASSMFVPNEMPACSFDADCAWYWTKSDADQDRPN